MALLALAPKLAERRKAAMEVQATLIVNALGKSLKAGQKKRGSRFGK